jgi:hypothetical protein
VKIQAASQTPPFSHTKSSGGGELDEFVELMGAPTVDGAEGWSWSIPEKTPFFG